MSERYESTTEQSDYALKHCGHCGQWHQGTCPRIKAIEYHENGTVKRVEYHDDLTRILPALEGE